MRAGTPMAENTIPLNNMPLDTFLNQWEREYKKRLHQIPLLDPQQAHTLSPQQRRYFAELFWHVRGHFAEFLFVLGNRAPDRTARLTIVENIADELGSRADGHIPHDVLYNRFSGALGADTRRYILASSPYPEFLRDYNQAHLEFLLDKPWETCAAAFAAYEHLDNADYSAVEEVGKVWKLDRTALQFFEVHRRGNHFNEVSGDLRQIWQRTPQAVQHGFTFISEHQLGMWQRLSKEIFDYRRK